MPAEREEVFSSMKESLDKIAASTAAMENFFSGTLEENIEGNRAQKLRDKEQQKQTEALEKLGKSQGKAEKESSFLGKHWGKLLLGLLGLLALMKIKMPKLPDADELVEKFVEGQKPENIGTPKETIQLNTQFADIANRFGGGVKNTVTGTKKFFKTSLPKLKTTILDTGKNIKRGFVPNEEDRERIRQNREAEKLRNQKIEIEKAEKKAYKEKEKREKAERKATRQRMADLEKENKQKREAARIRDNAEKQSKTLNKAERQRQNNINNTKGSLPKGIKRPPPAKIVVDPIEQAKKNVKTGIKWGTKAWRIWRATAVATASLGPHAGTAAMLGVTALEVWAETDSGKATLAENKVTIDEVGKEIYGKLFTPVKKAKNLRGTGLTRQQQIDRVTGREGYVPPASTDAATRRQVEKIQKKEPSWFERAKKFLRFGGREGQGAERISSDVAKMVALNPAMKDLIHISGSVFKAGGHDPMRITSGFRNRQAQRRAMESLRLRDKAQYEKNYTGPGNSSATSTDAWLDRTMSKHQHGNGIDIGYPKGIKGRTPRATAFVASINNKLKAEGFDGIAVEEGDHIHMTAGGPKTKAQADKFERDFNAFKENDQGQRLKQANQGVNGAGVNGGVTVNNYNNQSYKKTDTSNLITSGGATDPSSTGHPSANAKQ